MKQAIKNGKLKVDRDDHEPWLRMTDGERLELYKKCGAPCFMKVSTDPEAILADPSQNLKFPVCRVPRTKRSCAVSAAGVLAANRRARLTKMYPEIVEETRQILQTLGLTKAARANMPILSIRLREVEMAVGARKKRFLITLTYQDGTREILSKPLSAKIILSRYGDALRPRQLKKMMNSL